MPVDETPVPGEKPEDYVRRVAEMKALAVSAAPGETVLARAVATDQFALTYFYINAGGDSTRRAKPAPGEGRFCQTR